LVGTKVSTWTVLNKNVFNEEYKLLTMNYEVPRILILIILLYTLF